MADIFVRIDELHGYAASFAKLATESATAESSALSGFSEFVGAWGSDAPGHAFLSAYLDSASDTADCAQQVPVQLSAVSSAMRATAAEYLGTEATNVDLSKGTGA